MANYGRGWDDGYGGQSAEAIDAYQERDAIEGEQARFNVEWHKRQKAKEATAQKGSSTVIENCPQCALQNSLELTREQKTAERVALGMCWLDGGIVNDDGKPTVIRIDCSISKTHKAEMMALLKKIENTKEPKA